MKEYEICEGAVCKILNQNQCVGCLGHKCAQRNFIPGDFQSELAAEIRRLREALSILDGKAYKEWSLNCKCHCEHCDSLAITIAKVLLVAALQENS